MGLLAPSRPSTPLSRCLAVLPSYCLAADLLPCCLAVRMFSSLALLRCRLAAAGGPSTPALLGRSCLAALTALMTRQLPTNLCCMLALLLSVLPLRCPSAQQPWLSCWLYALLSCCLAVLLSILDDRCCYLACVTPSGHSMHTLSVGRRSS